MIVFDPPVERTILVDRPNRFILHCQHEVEGEIIVHLPDPGRLKELVYPGAVIWVQRNHNPKRRTQWSACLCETPHHTYVSLNTQLPNQLLYEAFQEEQLEEFSNYKLIGREVTVKESRFDIALEHKETKRIKLIEIKSVTYSQNGAGKFPDAVTKRGTKHVKELTKLVSSGEVEGAVLFVAGRSDIESVEPYPEIDPVFSTAMKEASEKGVEFYGRLCEVSREGVKVSGRVPVHTERRGT
ncbi:hypothetical protein Q73_15395 [Bacillus coahuilensis m2-6]|uniref:DNA/RNA nuclease SfsA n=1 Tax=Bacillus coahuilensis TaxID=408580 RepID=UPI000185070B|nr:DNA/RNA nuclease SfsA [Bacillus coahuilensis]KUP04512.1 hypothetical protein Q73_15395 [Bacillus coahuilensis m2-6]